MANLEKGKTGEKLAAKFLKKKKYRILFKNYKTTVGEIDLIAQKGDAVIFVEVKARASEFFGAPSESVTHHKRRKINQVASQFLTRHGLHGVECRFDVVEILGAGKNEEIRHIENAFDSYISW